MNKGITAGVITLIIGLLLVALTATDAYTLAFDKVRIEDKSYGSYEENEIAEGEIGYVIDKVGEAKMTKKLFGISYKKVTAPIYMISDNGGYVLLQSDKDADKLEILCRQTKDYFAGSRSDLPETIKYIGKATEVSDEILQVLDAYFTANNVPADNWEYAVSLYVLVGFDMTAVVFQLCLSFALVFVGILLILIFRRYVQGDVVYVGEAPPMEATPDDAAPATEATSDNAAPASANAPDSEE